MDQTPWLIPGSIADLDKLIQPDWDGFEWGSGGSTVWLGRRLRSLVSVEHQKEWHDEVASRLRRFGLGNVTLVYCGKSDGYYEEYADTIHIFMDGTIDFILVDGRGRARCLTNAIPKLAPGGVLVLDDSQREQYQEAIARVPAAWFRADYEGWENERKVTTIWISPR